MSPSPALAPVESEEVAETRTEESWATILWDDPVNLISYVIYVLQATFAFSKVKATELTMQVHNEGKAIVATGSREDMEDAASKLHAYGLWATVSRA
ncbi:ATP-dependent Clp protease adaptor protein ClpS [Acidimicrobium ferrooxidans DSM 10331]|uniref:ATP-dependent Clp protease adaptor protein ClpS n=1 Tax=Acidimicrobium ferrooxidans (strain DSM 10331 / JCM 15462 / NBRC 103882 / ICP) TaxID=525909 RepID=C7M265_ACIFD|nr:ATP-dependent Clp protease adaptor protein ClpS [Acidimicrobium ferrooxidans DSM 10331]